MKEIDGEFTREYLIRPAFNKRDPDPSKDYGTHNVEMSWTLIGPLGAVTLCWHTTDLDLPGVLGAREVLNSHGHSYSHMFEAFQHSPKPRGGWHDAEKPQTTNCQYTGGDCWSDFGFGCAEKASAALIAEGEPGLWRELRVLYDAWFVEEGAA